jgi:hypothetical protein
LSLRIDPKTKFVLDFMVRATGLRITDLIERAIRNHAESVTVGSEDAKNWVHYWHPEEGVRTLNMIFDPDIRTTFEEDEIAEFVKQHREFFLADAFNRPSTVFVQVLWPRLQEYVEHWRVNKAQDRWATGNAMLQAIKSAGMQGPEWPRGSKKGTPAARPSKGDDLDDDIPF